MCEIKYPSTTLKEANRVYNNIIDSFKKEATESWNYIESLFEKHTKTKKWLTGTAIAVGVSAVFVPFFLLLFHTVATMWYTMDGDYTTEVSTSPYYLIWSILLGLSVLSHVICGVIQIINDINIHKASHGEPAGIIADAIEKYRYKCSKGKRIDYINALRELCRRKLAYGEDISEFNYQFLTFGEHYKAFCNEIINIDNLQKINPNNLKVIGFEINEDVVNSIEYREMYIPYVTLEENIKGKFSQQYKLRLALETSSKEEASDIIRQMADKENIIIDLSYIDEVFAKVKY